MTDDQLDEIDDSTVSLNSWEFIPPNIAIKTLSKTCIFPGGGANIPKNYRSFFGIENLGFNIKRKVDLIFENKRYQADFQIIKPDRSSIQWKKDFMTIMRNLFPNLSDSFQIDIRNIDNCPKMEMAIHKEKNEISIKFIGNDIDENYPPFTTDDFSKLFSDLKRFIIQSHTNNLTTKSYLESFERFHVTKSFGQGTPAKVTWLSFDEAPDQPKFFFVSFYYDKTGRLCLVLGVKEDIKETYDWPNDIQKDFPRFSELQSPVSIASRYPKSRLFKEFSIDINDIDNSLEIQKEDIKSNLSKSLRLLLRVLKNEEPLASYWRLSPGKNGIHWDTWRNQKICSLGINKYSQYFEELLKIKDKNSFKSRLVEIDRIVRKEDSSSDLSTSHQNTIWSFFNEIKIGDIIIAATGKSRIYGIGRVKSDLITQNSEEHPVIREVQWDYVDLNVPVPEEVIYQHLIALNKLSSDDYSKIMASINGIPPTATNPLNHLLERKGQVILYGPPGTGKTYSVQSLIENTASTPYTIRSKDYGNVQFFWAITYKEKYDDFSSINKSSIYTYIWKSNYNYPYHFSKITEGDIFAFYLWDENRIMGFAKCILKEEDSFQYQFLTLINGPTYATLKEDPEFSKGKIIRTRGNARITSLEQDEFERLLFISGIKPEELGIKVSGVNSIKKPSEFITFHQSFSYEEFIEGLRPITDEDGRISYSVKEGLFKELCRTAYNTLLSTSLIEKRWEMDQDVPSLNDEEKKQTLSNVSKVPFYLVIDEINRGDISRIFGELITLLEKDKRLLAPHEIRTRLPSSRTRFGIPPNLYIIGTMNTADKSIALIDIALRRRFGFIEMMPDYDLLSEKLTDDDDSVQEVFSIAIALLQTINARILQEHDREHQIGHSFLLKLQDYHTREESIQELALIWYHEILPLLHEYFYDSPKKLFRVIGSEFMKSDPKSITFNPVKEGESFLTACKSITKGVDLDGISSINAL